MGGKKKPAGIGGGSDGASFEKVEKMAEGGVV